MQFPRQQLPFPLRCLSRGGVPLSFQRRCPLGRQGNPAPHGADSKTGGYSETGINESERQIPDGLLEWLGQIQGSAERNQPRRDERKVRPIDDRRIRGGQRDQQGSPGFEVTEHDGHRAHRGHRDTEGQQGPQPAKTLGGTSDPHQQRHSQ